MSLPAAIDVERLAHQYGQRQVLHDVSLQIGQGEIFAFVGPNGSGKTTLFRVLSTLIPLQRGAVRILGYDLATQTAPIRAALGVVFQAPSLDRKLTVAENIRYQGRLYGLTGGSLRQRETLLLDRLGLSSRRGELVETLSGGLRRRAELAKGMLHGPRILLLDEPSTGLDPGARGDLWRYLEEERAQSGVTIVLTTHLLEEADRADRIAILHQGRLVALDSPDRLRASVGGDSITMQTHDTSALAAAIGERFGCQPQVFEGCVRLEQPDGQQWIPRLVDAFAGQIDSITLGKPSLEDVFIDRTGHQYWSSADEEASHV